MSEQIELIRLAIFLLCISDLCLVGIESSTQNLVAKQAGSLAE